MRKSLERVRQRMRVDKHSEYLEQTLRLDGGTTVHVVQRFPGFRWHTSLVMRWKNLGISAELTREERVLLIEMLQSSLDEETS